MIYNDRQYVQQYSAEIRNAILGSRCKRWINQRAARHALPNTDAVEIPSPEQTGRALLREITRYYQTQRRSMPDDVSRLTQALRATLHDPSLCVLAINATLCLFVHSKAVIEDTELRNAVKSAQLCLMSLQSTWAEMPVLSTEYWVR